MQDLGAVLHSAKGYVLAYAGIAMMFAVIYYILNDMVGHALVRKALLPSASKKEKDALKEQLKISPAVRKIYKEQMSSPPAKPLVPVDIGTTLNEYQYYSFEFQVMNSVLTQVGIGGVFSHQSDAQRVVVIVQALSVMCFSAAIVAYRG